MKIRTRLILGFLLITGVSFYYLTDWIIKELRPHYLKALEESLVDTATLLAAWLSDGCSDTLNISEMETVYRKAQNRNFEAKIYDVVKDRMDIRIYITDAHGQVVFDSDNSKDVGKNYSRWINISRTLKGNYGARATRSVKSDPNSSVLHISSPILRDKELVGILTVAKPTTNVAHFIYLAQKRLRTTVIIVIIGVILFATLLSLWVTEPIQRLTAYIGNVKMGKHSTRPKLHALGVLGRSEMDVLGEALFEMQERLERRKYAEQYVQNLTHELKSPLSAIRGAVEIIDEKMPVEDRNVFLGNIRTESERIQLIVDKMLELARIESRTELQSVEQISLGALVNELQEQYKPLLSSKKIGLVSGVSPDHVFSGEKFLIYQCLSNLVKNAIEFSPEGSTITISSQVVKKEIRIVVVDEGSGIPEYALERIFERFYSLNRPGTERRSTGLGLSFVKESVELHGGSVSISNNLSRGATAVISLPL